MLQRNFLYTGVTRGKRLVVLDGQKKAVPARSGGLGGKRSDLFFRPSSSPYRILGPGVLSDQLSDGCVLG
jgi:hypothetical protein